MRHEWGQTPDELVSLASTKTDCWFSPAAFSGMSRKAKDCVGAAALWLDIDIGAQHAKPDYPDAKSFATDFKNFMAGTGLPVPWIVSTGHGVHLYWPLGATVQPDKWSRFMARLFTACNKFGLKYEVILRQGETDLRTLVTVLKQYEPVKQTAVRQEDSTRELRETAPVVNGCEQIRTCGAADYETWRNAARCLTFCKDGFETFHQLSEGDDRYDVDKCNETWDALDKNKYPPVLCSTFEKAHREVCARCPAHGRVTTPVMLGKKLAVKVDSTPVDNIRGVPFESGGFSVVPHEGIKWTFNNKDGAEVTLTIAPFEFYIMELVIDNRMLTPLRTYKARVVFPWHSP